MLVQNVYSVYDLKAETFSQPFFAVNDAVSRRMFGAAVQDPQTPVGHHPEDFVLYRVGAWNAENGAIAGCDAPIPVVTGLELKKALEVR